MVATFISSYLRYQLHNAEKSLFDLQANPAITCKSSSSNWIIPNHIMCGAYPGMAHGLYATSKEQALQNMKNILDDNIDTFVCLQSEILPVDDPYFCSNTFESYAQLIKDHKLESKTGNPIEYRHFPVHDQSVPIQYMFLEHMASLITDITNGRKVFIHCAGGHGRTGIYVACLLMVLYPASPPENILRFVQYMHDKRAVYQITHVPSHDHCILPPQSPNTTEQRDFVLSFAKFFSFVHSCYNDKP